MSTIRGTPATVNSILQCAVAHSFGLKNFPFSDKLIEKYLLTRDRPSFLNKPVIRSSGHHLVSSEALDAGFVYDGASAEIQTAVRQVLGLPDTVAAPYNAGTQSGKAMESIR